METIEIEPYVDLFDKIEKLLNDLDKYFEYRKEGLDGTGNILHTEVKELLGTADSSNPWRMGKNVSRWTNRRTSAYYWWNN